MKALKIEAEIDTPEVYFDPNTNIFTISGISHPENPKEFYEVILDWLDEFYYEIVDKQNAKIIADFTFKYINSASYKYLREILSRIANFQRNGTKVEIIWNYQEDDEDLLNEGMVLFEHPEINLSYRCIPYL